MFATCYIDVEKAFDGIGQVKFMVILMNIGVHWRDGNLIKELYINQKVQDIIHG